MYYKRNNETDQSSTSSVEYLYHYSTKAANEYSYWLIGPQIGTTKGGIMVQVLSKSLTSCPPETVNQNNRNNQTINSQDKNKNLNNLNNKTEFGASQVIWKSYNKARADDKSSDRQKNNKGGWLVDRDISVTCV